MSGGAPEEDVAKRLLLDENAFLRRKVEELVETARDFDWHEKDYARLKEAIRTVHGRKDLWDIQAAINDVNDLAAIDRLLDPDKKMGVAVQHKVEYLIEERDKYKRLLAAGVFSANSEKVT